MELHEAGCTILREERNVIALEDVLQYPSSLLRLCLSVCLSPVCVCTRHEREDASDQKPEDTGCLYLTYYPLFEKQTVCLTETGSTPHLHLLFLARLPDQKVPEILPSLPSSTYPFLPALE